MLALIGLEGFPLVTDTEVRVSRVGKYRLIRELGRGGMGVVHLAEDTRLHRQVALKLLHPSFTLDTDFVDRFASEARAIATMTHPGIVRVHAFEEVSGNFLIDMEYIEGGSLDRRLAGGPVSRQAALGIVLRVLEALAACHARAMVHRDVKPSNILLADDGRVLLSDFGLARSCLMASASATSSCFIGTPKYAAPESWGKSAPTPAGDVYSAGLVLLELLAGKTPFDGDTPLDIMRKAFEAAVVPVRSLLPDTSAELVGLIEDMLSPEPMRRPVDAGAALARLRNTPEYQGLPDDSSETMRITPPPPSVKPHGRSRQVATGFVALAALALVIGAVWWIQSPVQSPPQPPAQSEQEIAAAPAPAPTPTSPDVNNVFAVGDRVVFAATAGNWRSLWAYDSQTDSTAPLWPALTLDTEADIHGIFPVAHGVVAVIRSPSNGYTLFCTDGTPTGTVTLAYAQSRAANRIETLGAHAGKVYFNRIGGDETYGLWETDGSLEGTRYIWGGYFQQFVTGLGATPSGGLFFTSHNEGSVHYLPAGSDQPHLLWPEPEIRRNADRMAVLGERVILEANGINGEGFELWIGSPEAGSLQMLRSFMPGPAHGVQDFNAGQFLNGLVFGATTPDEGLEPWFTDGTTEGTRLLRDINPGAMGSSPTRYVASAGLLYFSAQDAIHGQELWVSDGTEAGTRMVVDIAPGLESGNPHSLLAFKGGVIFTAFRPDLGEELWFSDGTTEGTRLIRDCMPGQEGRDAFGATLVGERVVFAARHPDFGRILWVTDGTTYGTRPLVARLEAAPPPSPKAAAWALFKGEIYVTVTTPPRGAELWATDPASGKSRLVRDIYPGPKGSRPRDFLLLGNHLYFTAENGIHGRELWRSDGTTNGTALFLDTWKGEGSGNPHGFTIWARERIAFLAFNGTDNCIFYFRDNHSDFGVTVKPQHLGPHWNPDNLRPDSDEWLYFSNQTAGGETAIWRTDGVRAQRVPAHGSGDAED